MQTTTTAAELAADFDDLATIERLQRQHRAELRRREAVLLADEEACRALEALVAQRAADLLRQLQHLERTSRLATTAQVTASRSVRRW